MSPEKLLRALSAYALVLAVACVVVRSWATLAELPRDRRTVVTSVWFEGHVTQRVVRSSSDPRSEMVATGTVVEETAVAEGPLSLAKATFPLGLVPGRDGLRAELDGKTAWITTDDLLAAQAYDHASTFLDPTLGLGTDRAIVIGLLATTFGVPAADVERATVRRVRFERSVVGEIAPKRIDAEHLERAAVMEAIADAALHLARGVDPRGRYRYLVDVRTNTTLPGYNWPRHAGTTYFLAQAAALLDDATIRYACLRAAAALREEATKDCGPNRCIAEDAEAGVGASALALIAYAEIVRAKIDDSYRVPAAELARFLKSQQRPDGELMHFYDRVSKKPVDVQVMYYTGEAALALSRWHRVSGDPDDLRAASRALARLSGEGWSFFGSRYYFAEEHWTCQAVADLWERARDERALSFCLRWHEYQRRLQHDDGDSPFDGDGSFGFGPFVTPRVTPASSRGEAAVAALEVVRREGDHATAAKLDDELRRALAFVMRAQLRPGLRHLYVRPDLARGGIPGSDVDYQLRIDYAQHAGSMMIRYLEVSGASLATPRKE